MISHPMMDSLANEFTSTFALFEYALKEAGYWKFRYVKKEGPVEVCWKSFVAENTAIDDKFFKNLTEDKTTNYIIQKPPMYRVGSEIVPRNVV
jgi:hypothetical protein